MNKQNKKKLIREIDFKYNLKEYWGFLSKYKVKFYLLMLLALLLSFSYVVDKYIFKELIDRGTDFADGILTKTAFINILWILIIIFFSAVLIRTIFKWINHLFTFIFYFIIIIAMIGINHFE